MREDGSGLIQGHPRGLAVLAGTELWERISFHGMMALLTLYLEGQLLFPEHAAAVAGLAGFRAVLEAMTGPLSRAALATQIFGLYVGLAYFAPVLGGVLGDRVLGRRRSVMLGAVLMTAGHGCMAFDATFLLALLLLILGAGLLRGNLVPQLAALYPPGDTRAATGVQIYYAMVNVGFFIAPILTGALQQRYGWHVAFGFAGLGMLTGLAIYAIGSRRLPEDGVGREAVAASAAGIGAWRVVLLYPVMVLYWVVNSQGWNTYNLWARDHVRLAAWGMTVPVPWLQSLGGLAAFGLVPPALAWWRWLARRGLALGEIDKLALGCAIYAAFVAGDGCATLVFGDRVPLAWVVVSSMGMGFGYVHVAPVALGLVSRLAPAAIRGTMVGCYFATIFVGSVISGRLGALYEVWSPTRFWLLHAGFQAVACVLLLAMRRLFSARPAAL